MATLPKKNARRRTAKSSNAKKPARKNPRRFLSRSRRTLSPRLPKINFPTETSPTASRSAGFPQASTIHDLPFSYGETKLVLMVRDPYWAYSYWDFSGETWNGVQANLREDPALKPVMRVYDLTGGRSFDLLVSLEVKNWYLHLGTPDHRYVAELGLGDGKSRFLSIVRSNEVQTPRDSPSEVMDPEWPCKDMEELYRLWSRSDSSWSSPSSHFFVRKP